MPKNKAGRFAGLIIIVGMLTCLLGTYMASSVPNVLQYVSLAETIVPNTENQKPMTGKLALELERLYDTASNDLDAATLGWTTSGFKSGAGLLSDDNVSASSDLIAVGPNYFNISPKFLLSGRLFYPDELISGELVAVIDEQVALNLFKVSEPIDRFFTMDGLTYKVIGIIRHVKRVGDGGDYATYVPIYSVARHNATQLQTIQIMAIPLARGGSGAIIKDVGKNWKPTGDYYDMRKEKMGSWMILRWLIASLFIWVWFKLLKCWIALQQRLLRSYRDKLSKTYLNKLLLKLIGGALLIVGGYVVLGGCFAGITLFILEPVYTFPEWVPPVIVEFGDLHTTFWNLQAASSRAVEVRTPELIRMRYVGRVIQSGVLVGLIGIICFCLRNGFKKVIDRISGQEI